jgi:hypothetical protein
MGGKQNKEGPAKEKEGLKCPQCPKILKTEAARKGHITRFHKKEEKEQTKLKALAERINLIEKARGNDAQTPPAKVIINKPVITYPKLKPTRKETKELKRLELHAKNLARKEEKAKNKARKKAIKNPALIVPREKFYSEEHPNAFGLAKAVLPRMHILIICGYLLYSMYWEMARGNADFMLDWYKASPLSTIVEFTTSQNAFNDWLNNYGLLFSLVMTIIVLVLVTFYYSFWRLAFKDYYKFSEGSRRFEGRCYWRTNGGLMRWWDRKYRSPARTQNSYWIKIGWWPPLNLINPSNSLVRLDTTLKEKCTQKGIYAISVEELPLRRKVGNEPKHWTTYGGAYENGTIPNIYAEQYFTDRGNVLVRDTKKLSFGNAEVRVAVVRGGTSLVLPEWKEAVMDARRKRAERVQEQH